MKRFYKAARAAPAAGSLWHVMLDARAVKTPGKQPLILPTLGLAQAIAEEWQAQGQTVVPDTMPLTQYVCSALDRVAPARAQVIAQASAYAMTDLLAYPTQEPAELRALQDASWQPLLAQLRALGWNVRQTSGLTVIDQDPEVGPRARAWLESKSDLALTAQASLIETSGSFFLPYLLAQGAGFAVTDLIKACTLEERYSLSRWGHDAEAEQALARREADLSAAAHLLQLLT